MLIVPRFLTNLYLIRILSKIMHQTINFIDYFVMRRHYVDDIMLTSNDKYLIPMVNFDLKNTFDMEDLEK